MGWPTKVEVRTAWRRYSSRCESDWALVLEEAQPVRTKAMVREARRLLNSLALMFFV